MLSAKAGTPIADIERLLAQNGQELAFEPMDCTRLLGGDGPKTGTHRRRDRREPLRSAPPQGGRCARPHPRHQRRVGARRGLQVGRPRGQERHRLRSVEADGRLVGHARRADRHHRQGAARRRDADDARHPRPDRRARHGRDGSGDGLQRRSVGRGAPAARRHPAGRERHARRRPGDAAPRRRVWSVRRLSRRRAEAASEKRRPDRGDHRPCVEDAVARHPRLRAFRRRHGPAGLAGLDGAVRGAQNGAGAAHGGRRRRVLRLAGRSRLAAHGGRPGGRNLARPDKAVRRRPRHACPRQPRLACRAARLRAAARGRSPPLRRG